MILFSFFYFPFDFVNFIAIVARGRRTSWLPKSRSHNDWPYTSEHLNHIFSQTHEAKLVNTHYNSPRKDVSKCGLHEGKNGLPSGLLSGTT